LVPASSLTTKQPSFIFRVFCLHPPLALVGIEIKQKKKKKGHLSPHITSMCYCRNCSKHLHICAMSQCPTKVDPVSCQPMAMVNALL